MASSPDQLASSTLDEHGVGRQPPTELGSASTPAEAGAATAPQPTHPTRFRPRDSASLELRRRGRTVVLTAARVGMAGYGAFDHADIDELCHQTGISRARLRILFDDEGGFLAALYQQLANESADRFERALVDWTPSHHPRNDMAALARRAATSSPLDYAGLKARLERRVSSLGRGTVDRSGAVAESRFLARFGPTLASAMIRCGRALNCEARLAASVVVAAYERGLEDWLARGNSEHRFADSPFVKRTLPDLLLGLSSAIAPGTEGPIDRSRSDPNRSR